MIHDDEKNEVEAPGEEADELVALIQKRFKDAKEYSREWRKQAMENYKFVSGSGQWTDDELSALEEEERPPVTFNRIEPIIDAVVGTEINNRQELRYFPREPRDTGFTDLANEAAKYVRDNCDAEDEESEAFRDMLVSGMGWTETRMDYEENPDGDILIEQVNPLEMFWDPSVRKKNLKGSRYRIRAKYISRDDIEALWPDKAEDVGQPSEIAPEEIEGYENDPHDATEAWMYENDATGYDKSMDAYVVLQYQWWDREKFYRFVNPATGKQDELTESKFRILEPQLRQMGIRAVAQRKKVYKQAFVTGETLLESGPAPCKYGFSFNCMTGKKEQNKNIFYGLVRPMMDPQRWSNKFFSQIIDIMNKNTKGGILYEKGAFSNIRKAEEDWARSDAMIELNPGALSGNKVKDKPMTQYPVGMDRMMAFAVDAIPNVTGVNLELLGLVSREQAGVLEESRKKAGLTILAYFLNSLRLYRKQCGRVLMDFITTYISDGRLVRIGSPGSEKYVKLLKSRDAAKFDVVVGDSPTSPSMKDRVWETFGQMLPALLKAKVPIPPDVLDFSPLPESVAQKWKQYIMGKQKDPFKETMKQVEIALKQAKVEESKANAVLDYTKAMVERAQMGQDNGEGMKQMNEMMKNQIDGQQAQLEGHRLGLEKRKQDIDVMKANMDLKKTIIQAGNDNKS